MQIDQKLTVNINRLLLRKGAVGVSADEITQVVIDSIGKWTVNADDFDSMVNALSALRNACRDLPPGWYATLKPECDRADKVLLPNTQGVTQRGENQ